MDQRYKGLGAFIKKHRRAMSLTQLDVAHRLEISVQSVSQWENGRTKPEGARLQKLCELLGIDLAAVVDGRTSGVGDIIRAARIKNGLSQQQLADHVGANQQTIHKIEAGAIEFSRSLPAIAAALEIDLPMPDWLAPQSKPDSPKARTALEIADVLACLTAYVRVHGKREGLLDALLPAERQEEGIARAMGLIEYLSREEPPR